MFRSCANACISVFTLSAGLTCVITDHTQLRYFPRRCCFLMLRLVSPLCVCRTRSGLWTNSVSPSTNTNSAVLFLLSVCLNVCVSGRSLYNLWPFPITWIQSKTHTPRRSGNAWWEPISNPTSSLVSCSSPSGAEEVWLWSETWRNEGMWEIL